MKSEEQMREQYRLIRGALDERGRREWAASEAMALGYGGIALVHRASGIVPSTIGKGIKELESARMERPSLRRGGGCAGPGVVARARHRRTRSCSGRWRAWWNRARRGDPESALRWTCKSLRALAEELARLGHAVSYRTVGRLLKGLDYSPAGDRKKLEGTQHADRNADSLSTSTGKARSESRRTIPAISVDTRRRSWWGVQERGSRVSAERAARAGRCTRLQRRVGSGEPYGVYDMKDNSGWVSVGVSADTSEFAVESIRRWWNSVGYERYSQASELFITAGLRWEQRLPNAIMEARAAAPR